MPTPRHPNSPQSPGQALSASIGSESFDLVATVGDTAVDAAITSGVLDGVPILGLASSAYKAQREIRDHLYMKKVVGLLQGIGSTTSAADRDRFVEKLQQRGEYDRFGETILLLLEQVDDARKPSIMGRILAAHMSGKISSYDQAMRLVSMVNRTYAVDLGYLKTFTAGVQRGEGVEIASSLAAVGLLANAGFDGGGFDQTAEPGGLRYGLSDYGRLLLEHGLA